MWAHFESEVSKCEDDSYYGASIPLEDIMYVTHRQLLSRGVAHACMAKTKKKKVSESCSVSPSALGQRRPSPT